MKRLSTILCGLMLMGVWLVNVSTFSGVAAAAPGASGPALTPPGINLALYKHYTLLPRPNYRYCTDPGDATQLTDGKYSKGHFWTQPGTVGWNKTRPVLITIDLGKVEPIRGVSFNTAAGVAGAHFPQAILVFVSDENKSFHLAGDLVALDEKHGKPKESGYSVHRYWTDALETHGRYVAIAVDPADYTFVDEIEVYRGEDAWLGKALGGKPAVSVMEAFRAACVTGSVQRRLRADAQAVRELTERVKPAERGAIEKALGSVDVSIRELTAAAGGEISKAILPLNNIHRSIFQLQGRLWRGQAKRAFSIWSHGQWDLLPTVHTIPEQSSLALSLALMQNEYRAAAFNISNHGAEDCVAGLSLEGLPGGAAPDWVAVHEVQWTDTATSHAVLAALPGAERKGDAYLIHLPAGMTRQVWLAFHPRQVKPGTYQATIRLRMDPAATAKNQEDREFKIPLSVRVSPLRFPDRPTLHLGGWDYTDIDEKYDVTDENRAALIAHLREHFVDSPWGTAATIPHGKHAADGRMTESPKTTVFDKWLKRWPGARQYMIHASVGTSFDKFRMGTPEFDRAVQDWIRFWAGYVKKKGIEPGQLNLLVVDEPRGPEYDSRIVAWAKAIRAAGTGVRIWEDATHKDPATADPQVFALSDVLCPNRPMFMTNPQYHDFYAKQRPAQTELAFYSCSGPARLLDPYSYYRLQAWECWRHGAKGMYYWAFGDAGGGSCWNEYAAHRTGYTPLFLDATSVTAGKQMEAIREGVEDYEYFVMLRAAVEKAEKAGVAGEKKEEVAKARRLLETAAARVLDAPGASEIHWSSAKDRGIADQVRVEILEALEGLQ